MLRCSGITKSLGSKALFADVSICVNPGEITVLTGPSGGGKTTLLRCLSLLDSPDKGVVQLDDRVFDFNERKQHEVGIPYPYLTIVFQQLFLWPHLTNRENILLPLGACGDAEQEHLRRLVAKFEMANFIDNYPNQSSLGQKQRVALARALVLKPKYILFDEVTSALDTHRAELVMDELSDLRESGVAILLITHDTAAGKKVGNTFYNLENGSLQLVSQGGKSDGHP
jgi:ABC-type polar amino acid transport system ATPase subunit